MSMMVGQAESMPVPGWLPDWVGTVGSACWVCDPEGHLVHLNDAARRLFGVGDAALGRSCHQVVRGLDEAGGTFCRDACPAWGDAMMARPLRPRTLRARGPDGRGPWALVWIVPLTGPHGTHPWLVHCAYDQQRAHVIESYLRRVASRSPPVAPSGGKLACLTPRQREILALLACDDDPQRIAQDLCLSYATVRNHVRQLLERLGVHSTQEAVARYLLQGDGCDLPASEQSSCAG